MEEEKKYSGQLYHLPKTEGRISTMDNWENLLDNIFDNFDESKLIEIGTIGEGIKYNYTMNLTGPNGNTRPVKTTWILRSETNTYQLVTAIVLKEVQYGSL